MQAAVERQAASAPTEMEAEDDGPPTMMPEMEAEDAPAGAEPSGSAGRLQEAAAVPPPISDGNADMDIDQMELDDVSVLAFLFETNCVGEVYSPPRVVPYC